MQHSEGQQEQGGSPCACVDVEHLHPFLADHMVVLCMREVAAGEAQALQQVGRLTMPTLFTLAACRNSMRSASLPAAGNACTSSNAASLIGEHG